MAYEEALANYDPKCNNRVIMGTDGDFNVGVTSTDALVEMVESYARKGIYMTCLGFGMGNLNDAMMEKISNAGNGTYHYIDCENEMMKVFVHERSQFVSVANDAKCQVTFDSTLVSQYRLIGYENRVMANEDFENDEKDAAEVGAGQTITALYEIVTKPEMWNKDASNPPIVTFDCRYKKSLTDSSRPLKVQRNSARMWGDPSTEFYLRCWRRCLRHDDAPLSPQGRRHHRRWLRIWSSKASASTPTAIGPSCYGSSIWQRIRSNKTAENLFPFQIKSL